MTAVDPRPSRGRASRRARSRRRRRSKVAAYVALTKPRIIELLLVTTVPDDDPRRRSGLPSLRLVARHAGRRLPRRRRRQRAQHVHRPRHRQPHGAHRATARSSRARSARAARSSSASLLAVALGGLVRARRPTCWPPRSPRPRSSSTSSATRCCSSAARRRTSCGAAPPGCMPILIGWAAVTGSLTWAPIVLFGVVFFWTPPHYWPLSLRFKDDYAAAGVPMLPVVAPLSRVAREIIGYSWAMVAHVARCSCPRGGMTAVLRRGRGAARRRVPLGGARPAAPGAARRPGRQGRCACSTARSPTWRCCSSWSPSTRCCPGRPAQAAVTPPPRRW